MAILKVCNRSTNSHSAMKKVLKYILQDAKVREGYFSFMGPDMPEIINADTIYDSFLGIKKIWGKDSGRMYTHNIISFHPTDPITAFECLDFGLMFAGRFYLDNQLIIAIHQDRDHLHLHLVANTVSYTTGRKIHQSAHSLQEMKDFINKMCLERGLSVAEKGKHYDGSRLDEGTVSSWSKDKYKILQNNPQKSYLADCAIAVLSAREKSCDKEDFIHYLEEAGWYTTWTEKHKKILFKNANGETVSNANLSYTFSLPLSKEDLEYEFIRNKKKRILYTDPDQIYTGTKLINLQSAEATNRNNQTALSGELFSEKGTRQLCCEEQFIEGTNRFDETEAFEI